jgi:uncharacterized membrane protein
MTEARSDIPMEDGTQGGVPGGAPVGSARAFTLVPPARRDRLHPRWSRCVSLIRHLPLVVLMLAYALRFGDITVNMLRAYDQDAYDMAIPDQGIWLLSRFHSPFVTVMGKNLFGDHTSFLFLFLVPLDWIYPHAAALLVIQAVVIAAGAIPIYLLAQHLLKSTVLSACFAAAYLLSPALQQGNLEQFHVEAFEVPLLALAIYAAVVWKPRLLLVSIALVLLAKQDVGLYTIPLGLWVAVRRSSVVGAAIVAGSAAVGLLENFLIIPVLLNGVPTTYGGWIPFGGIHGFAEIVVRKPGQLWAYLTSQGRPFYLWQMIVSAGLVFLIAPELALLAILGLGENVISDFPYQHQIVYHYSMPPVAFLVCGSIYAVSRLSSQRRRALATVAVTMCALWSSILWGALPFSDAAPQDPNPNLASDVAIGKLLQEIPPNAVVSAANNYVPNLDHRVGIYQFPNPFSQAYYGDPSHNGEELPSAHSVQYLVLPACFSCDPNLKPYQSVFDRFEGQFHEVGRTAAVILYERTNRSRPVR